MHLRSRWVCRPIFQLCLVLAALLSTSIATEGAESLGWLQQQAGPDGRIGGANGMATDFQATAEAHQTLSRLQPDDPRVPEALRFLDVEPALHTEYLARLIVARLLAGDPVADLVPLLRDRQNPDGGFADTPGDASTVLDTAFALEALSQAKPETRDTRDLALGFLQQRQTGQGGWADGNNDPSVYLTALAMRAVWRSRNDVDVSSVLTQAQAFLISQRQADGRWSTTFETALALIALVPGVADLSLVDASAMALRAEQLADGSWEQDVYVTALAARALHLYDARQANPQVPGPGGALSGHVTQIGTGAPLQDARVTLSTLPGVTVQTNAEGFFFTSRLAPG